MSISNTVTTTFAAARTATASTGTTEAEYKEVYAQAAEEVLRAQVAGLRRRAEAADAPAADRLAMLRAVLRSEKCDTCGAPATWRADGGDYASCDRHNGVWTETPFEAEDAPLIRRAVEEARKP